MTDSCAPNNYKNDSCFPDEVVRDIAKRVNSQTSEKLVINKNGKELMSEVRSTMKCEDDVCVVKNEILGDNKSKLIEYFKPPIPKSWEKNPTTWTSTLDIDQVLSQYENKYKDFKYLGAVPIDFDTRMSDDVCVSDDLCKINMRELWNSGKRNVGMVFNLDPHYKSGSHWVSMFVDGKNGGIYYFDSVGKEPPVEVQRLMGRVAGQLNGCIQDGTIDVNDIADTHRVKKSLNQKVNRGKNKLYLNTTWLYEGCILHLEGDKYTIKTVKEDHVVIEPPTKRKYKQGTLVEEKCWRQFYNDVGHQRENTECGIYSMYFISSLLDGKRFNDFLGRRIPDSEMEQYRKRFFRPRENFDYDINI